MRTELYPTSFQQEKASKRILFLANHFVTLYTYRRELIGQLIKEGHEVFLSLPESQENSFFEKLGCTIIPTKMDRRGMNPIKDMALIRSYKKIMTQVKPDIVFSYTIKPNIYGTIASNAKGCKQVCNVTGTGATFLKRSLVSEICTFLYKISMKKCYKVFFQNTGDRDYFVSHGMVQENHAMLPGSGCNLDEHKFLPMPEGDDLRFIFIGRVMHLKGIDEYLECARIIKEKYPNMKFYIAGWHEEEDYQRIVAEEQEKGTVEYIGFRKDIADWIAKCHCTVLPSHGGEGVPNVLLESAATGRVCIASKINGSTDVVEDGVTGYLFNTGDATDLVAKVEAFIQLTAEQRAAMGKAGREKVEREFDRKIVINKYLDEVRNA